ncbi:MAG: LTA synthase family protein, partial [Flavobacteriales bacterium]
FDRYFGRSEYGDDTDFDGNWGIYDMPFLQRMSAELDKTPQPFVAAVFTLSSHHPYKVPAPFDRSLPTGSLPIHQSVRYADESLRRFFATAARTEWFKNTLFVITSDHTSLSEQARYQTQVGIYSIPIAYYSPGKISPGISARTTQQIDILPSLLDRIGYPQPFYSLGNSVFDSTAFPFAISQLHGDFQIISNGFAFTLDTLNGNSLFHYTNDSLMNLNLVQFKPNTTRLLESRIKAVVQQYTNSMLKNNMTVPTPQHALK